MSTCVALNVAVMGAAATAGAAYLLTHLMPYPTHYYPTHSSMQTHA
jgi:hypothetical protein